MGKSDWDGILEDMAKKVFYKLELPILLLMEVEMIKYSMTSHMRKVTKLEEILSLSCDADKDVLEKDWDILFEKDDSSDNLDVFNFLLCDCNQ